MILSIESSCDDSSIAVTEIATKKLLFHKKISQELDHAKYGGVVPELAARLHATALPRILEQTKPFFPDLKAVAVTNAPGLAVTLVEGVTMAKALAIALDLPLIGVNHLHGHIYSLFLERESAFPMTVLLVSGGHTQVIDAKGYKDFSLIAQTMDDSFGESFDKVAKMLGLGYPGGPIVEAYAQKGDENRFDFTVPLANSGKIAFSYSGLKNQVRLQIAALGEEISDQDRYDICASFQRVATAHLLQKLKKIFKTRTISDFAIVGGASANLYLREKIEALCGEFGASLHLAPLAYCSDNAAMIGRCGIEGYLRGDFTDYRELVSSPRSAL
ncbi:MAG TPA: tRNA (adenosine(37)-N6)-threonylcarbamoyltransferase complex transferase subunit TsaD [Campylobacteraceae bacterium]|nr:tRNA (adenosine(37)-N6)-threonylcarbamoyltransferase complex transferase subunit TsaD [Campylobacteraceae bacterium]HHD84021.1 tRNA (adenosine(37)-N6)-threonylcarbamoyltransferase complex transferase subunit TsaD [Campylobacteraceae bacterium]